MTTGNSNDLDLSLDPDGSNGLVVSVTGEVDVATAPELLDALAEATDRYATIFLDMSGVSFLDSTGLRALIAARESAGLAGVELRLSAASSVVENLLALTGMGQVVGWDPDGAADR
jgi:anti-sigma B factor antagonist